MSGFFDYFKVGRTILVVEESDEPNPKAKMGDSTTLN
jgi:hypothetical protein